MGNRLKAALGIPEGRELFVFHSVGTAFLLQLFALNVYSVILSQKENSWLPWEWYVLGSLLSFVMNAAFYAYVTRRKVILVSISPLTWPAVLISTMLPSSFAAYVLALAIAVVTKFTVRLRNRHVFNPGVLTVIVMFYLTRYWPGVTMRVPAPNDAIYDLAGWVLGILVSTIAGRIWASSAYVAGILCFQWVVSPFSGAVAHYMPISGIQQLIFIFHALTDPATSPSSRGGQIAFGLFIAALTTILLVVPTGVPATPMALTLACFVYSLTFLPAPKALPVPSATGR